MKTTDPRDQLDQQIDALLKSRPLQPSDDFASRVLNACQPVSETSKKSANKRPIVIRFALPIAAAIAIALLSITMLKQENTQAPHTSTQLASNETIIEKIAAPSIEEIEAQEIFLIEEGLADIALADEATELGSGKLLATFDALLYEIQS